MKKFLFILIFMLFTSLLFAFPFLDSNPTYDELKTMLQQTTKALETTTDQLKTSNEEKDFYKKEKEKLQTENNNFRNLLSGSQKNLEDNNVIITELRDQIKNKDQAEINTLRNDITLLRKDTTDLINNYTEQKRFAVGGGIIWNGDFGTQANFIFQIPIIPFDISVSAGTYFSSTPKPFIGAGVLFRF